MLINVPAWCVWSLVSLLLVACGSKPGRTADMALPSSNLTGGASGSDSGASGSSATEAPMTGSGTMPQAAGAGERSAGSGGMPTQSAGASGGAGNGSAGSAAPVAGMGGGMATSGAGSAGTAGKPSMLPIADDGWPIATPEAFGLDKNQLESLAGKLQSASGNTRAGLVIVKDGALVYEKYWEGAADTLHQVFSCTKSWGSTLIGIAVHQSRLTVEDAVTKWVPSPAREVSKDALIKHLLTQSAQTTPPGTAFAYNSGSIVNTLPEILEAASSMSSHAFFEMFLAKPLKLKMKWPTCPAGGCAGTRYKADYIQFGDQGPNAVLQSTIRDQAKLGWLWLDDGVWNGERLLDTEYIRAATKPSFDFQAVYGYLWWLNREGRSSVLSYNSAVPNDMYHAVGGIGNCSVAVLPTQRIVIAHVGSVDSGGLGGHWEVFAPLFKP